jgi:hypothetical protein
MRIMWILHPGYPQRPKKLVIQEGGPGIGLKLFRQAFDLTPALSDAERVIRKDAIRHNFLFYL